MHPPYQLPSFRDPRWLFAGLLTSYAVIGSMLLGINRDLWQILLTVSLSITLDLSLAWLLRGERIFPLSAYITGLGLSLLINYPHDYYLLGLPVFFAIASKYVFTFQGRHVFNPALFGVLSALWLGGGQFATSPPYQWGAHPWWAASFLGVAALFCFVGKIQRTPLIVTFLLSFTLLTLVRAWFMRWHLPPETLIAGTLISPAFFLFAFYMVTDPKTSPAEPRAQVLWAVAIAVLDFLLHLNSSLATIFIALFSVTLATWAWRHVREVARTGWTMLLPPAAWLRSTAVLALLGVSGWLLYTNIIHAKVSGPTPGFTFVKLPSLEEPRLGHTLTEVDPRVAHVAKWVLSVGSAVAVGDYDGDGLMDYFVTNPLMEPAFRNALYRNEGGMKFKRIPLPALDEISQHPKKFGLISCALFVDFDNSGRQSLLLTSGWGKVRLLKNTVDNQGAITFRDVTAQSGIDEYTVSIAATMADFSQSGKLDLFIGNALSPTLPDYPVPTEFNIFHLPAPAFPDDRRMFHFMHSTWHNAENGGHNAFYRNDGGGHFTKQDVRKIGLPETHWTMAVGVADFNRDGWPDLYCASDYGPDDIYLNDGGKGFKRQAGTFSGSVGRDTYKGMNVSIGDLDNSGALDVYVSNVHAPLQAEGSLAWHVDARGQWHDRASPRRIINEQRFGWGAAMGDLNLDGHLDLIQVNGMVDDTADKLFPEKRDYWYRASQVMRAGPDVHSYADRWPDLRGYDIWGHQLNRVYLSDGGSPARFRDVADVVGVTEKSNSRAVAMVDLDNDGRLDAIVVHQFAGPDILHNVPTKGTTRHWVGFHLVGDGREVNSDAVGATVHLRDAAGNQRRDVSLTSGFSAQSDRRLHFGLADGSAPIGIEIRWPNGKKQRLENIEPDKYHRIAYPRE